MSRTKTLLDGVNDVLIRGGQITSTTKLVSLASPQTQRFVDAAVNLWQDAVQDIYTLTHVPMPSEVEEYPFALQVDTRDYALPDDLRQIRWPIEDRERGQRIYEYTGGWEAMRAAQRIPGEWTGLPYRAAIDPRDRKLWMERAPTSAEAGRIYTMTYDKTVMPAAANDLFPFVDDVYHAMVPLVTSLWEAKQMGQSTELGKIGYGRASRLLSGEQMRAVY